MHNRGRLYSFNINTDITFCCDCQQTIFTAVTEIKSVALDIQMTKLRLAVFVIAKAQCLQLEHQDNWQE